MEVKEFKFGDYIQVSEIDTYVLLLKANGWIKGLISESGDDCIVFESGYFTTRKFKDLKSPIYNELSVDDFVIRALRLKLHDGMRSGLSSEKQRDHIAKELSKLNVTSVFESPETISISGISLSPFNTIWFFPDDDINHIYYREWCKRLNIDPIHENTDSDNPVLGNSSIIKNDMGLLADFIKNVPIENIGPVKMAMDVVSPGVIAPKCVRDGSVHKIEKMQTAFHLLLSEMKGLGIEIPISQATKLLELLSKVEEMSKSQIKDAYLEGCKNGEMFNNGNRCFETDAEQYYNNKYSNK